jgi:hypothetical protein
MTCLCKPSNFLFGKLHTVSTHPIGTSWCTRCTGTGTYYPEVSDGEDRYNGSCPVVGPERWVRRRGHDSIIINANEDERTFTLSDPTKLLYY